MVRILEFGRPHNGWLPVELTLDGRTFVFEASHIPEDPVSNLISAVHRAAVGLVAEVEFELEPGVLRLAFLPEGEKLCVSVQHQVDRAEAAVDWARAHLARGPALLGVWRSLRTFEQLRPAITEWPATEFSGLTRLRQVIDEIG